MQRAVTTIGLLLLSLTAGQGAEVAPVSALFPLCWGGRGNDAVYYTEGLMLRQLVLFSNPSQEQALTNVRLVMEIPTEGVEVVKAVMSDGYGRVKTEMRQEAVTREGAPATRITCPMWDIKPGFTWKGKTPWSAWPGWWSALYVKGKRPGRYALAWHLECDQGREPENTAPLVVLPRPAPAGRGGPARPGAGVGVWAALSVYGEWPEVVNGMADALAACGVSRAYLSSRVGVKALQERGVEVSLTSTWPYSVFAPADPPDEARAVNEKGERIPGNSWCPTHVAERGAAWEKAVRPRVTDAMRAAGADGFMLDYEGAAAPGYAASNICFCQRCREAFAREAGATDLAWPQDVRPSGRLHARWLGFRCRQGEMYVKHVADLAREARPDARTYTWSGGYYKPYPGHAIYSDACSDITRFARHLTAPTVGTYVYPNDLEKAFEPNPEFGKDPANWGRGIPNMVEVIRWSADALRPQPVIPCVSGGHTPGGSATPLADVNLLRYQIANHLLDGARGADFWGSGPAEDGRYLVLLAELSAMFRLAQPYLGAPATPLQGVETDARRWRAGEMRSGAGRLIVLSNGDDQQRTFRVPAGAAMRDARSGEVLPVRGGRAEITLEGFEVLLAKGK